jgi:hypothetical protein
MENMAIIEQGNKISDNFILSAHEPVSIFSMRKKIARYTGGRKTIRTRFFIPHQFK